MLPEGSVTHWVGQLKAGDHAAAQKLWECYFQQLVKLARRMLLDTPRRAADEEDVALSAFDSFCGGAERGNFPELGDRHNLWRLLVVITARKALDLRQHEARLKRHAPDAGRPAEAPGSIEKVIGPEPTPEFAALVADSYRQLLAKLGDPVLERIAQWKMENYTNEEIAAKLSCVPRTVERKLRVIRGLWANELSP